MRQHPHAGDRANALGEAIRVAFRSLAGAGRGGRESDWEKPHNNSIPLPALRGRADALAVAERFGCETSGLSAKFPHGDAQAIVEILEQARCEALGRCLFPGVGINLDAALDFQVSQENWSGLEELRAGDLAQIVGVLARELIGGAHLPPAARHHLDLWHEKLPPGLKDDLRACGQYVSDPVAFARAAERVLWALGFGEPENLKEPEAPQLEPPTDPDLHVESPPEAPLSNPTPEGTSPAELPSESGADSHLHVSTIQTPGISALELASLNAVARVSAAGDLGERDARGPGGYSIYTTEFDEVIDARALCDPTELLRLRQQLDAAMQPFQSALRKAAGVLQRKLLARRCQDIEIDQEEGTLDHTRLARVIASPTHPRAYRKERICEISDTAVTLLIDNSASMRGQSIRAAAAASEMLARTLEHCGVAVEILGYTTRAWNGGRARQRWLNAERPSNPGRLNELRHIIYKRADLPFARGRAQLGLMLELSLLKENIDGEALLWAYRRLLRCPQQRRILIVICDGLPIDDATLSTNGADFLSAHLHSVCHQISRLRQVELLAIGIRRDVSAYYPRAIQLSDVSALGVTLLTEVSGLFR